LPLGRGLRCVSVCAQSVLDTYNSQVKTL